MAVAAPGDLSIVLHGETYSMVEVPSETSQVVKKEQEFASGGSVDLATFSHDLANVGKFIQVAYTGVVAAGFDEKCTALALKIRESSVRVADLCDQSAVTVAEFRQSSSSVLSDLQATYQLLLGGMEDIAVITYASAGKVAAQMKEKAHALADGFDREKENVEGAAKTTKQLEDERNREVQSDAKEMEKLKIGEKAAEEKKKIAGRDEERAQTRMQEFEYEERKAFEELGNMSGWAYFIESLFGKKTRNARQLGDKRREELRIAEERRREKLKAIEEQAKCAKQLQDIGKHHDIQKVSAIALNSAGQGLKRLGVVMRRAEEYWKRMESYCQHMGNEKISKMMEIVAKKTPEERLDFWTQPFFKKLAVEFYAKWVAMGCVCNDYLQSIKVTQKELYEHLVENPTYEDARRIIPRLTQEMIDACSADTKAILEASAAEQKEREELEKSVKTETA